LSVPSGRISVTWRIASENDELRFRWTERGGPVVRPPERKGFGSVVLEQVVARDFGRAPRVLFAPDGLTYEVTAALANIAVEPAMAAAAD
jgi:two-component sensor histidine kinase